MMDFLIASFKKYLGLYQRFVTTCLSQAMSFRLNFVIVPLMDLAAQLSLFLTTLFIFDHVDQIGPWNQNQFLFFVCFIMMVDYFHMTFVSESFWWLSEHIRSGSLDFILLKPANSIFVAFFRHFRPASAIDFIIMGPGLIYYGVRLGFDWPQWLLLPPLLLLGTALMVSLEILFSMAMFWTVDAFAINFLRMQLQHLPRWPDFVYLKMTRRVFTWFIPVLLVSSAPARVLYDQTQWMWALALIGFLLATWLGIAFFWKLGLRKYESASS